MPAPRGSRAKLPRVQDAGGLGGQRQQAHQDFAARQQRVEPVRPGEGLEALDRLGAAAPAGDRKTERLQLAAGILAERAEAENADRPLGGVLLLALLPRPGALLRQVVEVLAVQPQTDSATYSLIASVM